MTWRVGGKIPLNVYEDDKPMFQCHTPEDAARVVGLLNDERRVRESCLDLAREAQGFLSMADRQSHGNTNIQVMTIKIKKAFEACSAAPGKQEVEA